MTKNIPAAQVLLSELCDRVQLGLVPKKSTKETTGNLKGLSHSMFSIYTYCSETKNVTRTNCKNPNICEGESSAKNGIERNWRTRKVG